MMKAKYEKLPKRFKTKWLKALRSGKYQRGYCELGQDTEGGKKYCCLGVALTIQGAPLKTLQSQGYIPHKAGKRYKVPKQLIDYNELTRKLSGMNDLKQRSFKQIANWIEKNL